MCVQILEASDKSYLTHSISERSSYLIKKGGAETRENETKNCLYLLIHFSILISLICVPDFSNMLDKIESILVGESLTSCSLGRF